MLERINFLGTENSNEPAKFNAADSRVCFTHMQKLGFLRPRSYVTYACNGLFLNIESGEINVCMN